MSRVTLSASPQHSLTGRPQDFLDSLETLRTTHPNNPAAVTSRQNFSRKAARNVLGAYDSKEIKLGIAKLRERITKHFAGEEQEALSRALIGSVFRECERAYEKTLQRIESVIAEFYPPGEGEKTVEVEWGRAEVQAAFKQQR